MKKQGVFLLSLFVLFLFGACPKPELKAPAFTSASEDSIAKIVLHWERNYEADYYDLHFSENESGPFSLLKEKIEDTMYIDESDEVKNGTKRYYMLVAVDVDVTGAELRRSLFSSPIAGISIGFDSSLTAVNALSAKVLSIKTEVDPAEESVPTRFTGIQISWEAMEKADYYGVWRSVDGGEMLRVLHRNDKESIPLLLVEPRYSDFTLEAGHSYQYEIRPLAINKVDPTLVVTGGASSLVSITMPALETYVSWSVPTGSSAKLKWSPIPSALGYRWNRIQGDSLDFVFPTVSGDLLEYDDTGLDSEKTYTYALYVSLPIELLVGGIIQPDVPVATYVFDTGKSVTVSFFEKIAALSATQGTASEITLTWNNTNDITVEEFDIYRQKERIDWNRQGGSLSFPNVIYNSIEALEAEQVSLFQNNSFSEQSKLLFLGSTPAVDSGGVRLTSITYVDQSQDLQKMHPGLYRYYIVAGRSVISTTAYRSITNKEFLQEVSRQLDRAMSILYGGKTGTISSTLGGTYSVAYETNGQFATGYEANYRFDHFKTPFFTFHTPNAEGLVDKSIGNYQVFAGYYSKRFGHLEVTGLYEGNIDFSLSRDPKSAKTSGGAVFAPHSWALTEKDLGFSSSGNLFLGFWTLERGSVPAEKFRWDDSDVSLYQSASAYNERAKALEPKVEPNYQSDYLKWE